MRVPRRLAVLPFPPSRPSCRATGRAGATGRLAATAVVVLVLAGCGGDDGETTPDETAAPATTVGVTTTAGPTTTGADGERTTPEGMVLPAYADGRSPTAADDAPCTVAALERAVRADIDVADRPPSYIDCSERYAVAVVDFGSCPPADGEQGGPAPVCAKRKVAYWKAVDGRWRLLTYVPEKDASCDVARGSGEPGFPDSLCVPKAAG